MNRTLALTLILGLAACGETPAPKPAAPAPVPQAKAPEPKAPEAKAPEAKAPEAPKPDPNKELARRVKQALEKDTRVPGGAIDVTAKEGRVSLWGTTSNESERSRAAQIAAKVEGVTSVDNQLKIVTGS